MDLNFHHMFIEILVLFFLMGVRMTVLAVFTLAVLGTLEPSTVTFTVSFLAHGFFAGATTGWYEGRYTFKMARMSQISQHLSLIYLYLIALFIMAAGAFTVASTNSPISKTLTIEFKTSYFGAPAPMMLPSRLLHHPRRLCFHELIFGIGLRICVL